MTTALVLEGRELALSLHESFSQLDRSRRDLAFAALRARLAAERDRLASLEAAARASGAAPLRTAAQDLVDSLEELPADTLPPSDARRAWLAVRRRVQPAYERLVSALRREEVLVPSLRPTNYARNALHLASAALGIVALELLPSWEATVGLAVAFSVTGWTMEITRRQSPAINRFCLALFGSTAHPHEAERINSATWYSTALVLLALSGVVPAALVALAVLGCGDPAAAIVGRRFGRFPLVHGRTLEGSLAFVAAGGAAASTLVGLLHPELGLGTAVLTGLAGGAFGAVAEAISRRVDDNLTIPLAAFAGAWLTMLALG
jgi:dolichol kinase